MHYSMVSLSEKNEFERKMMMVYNVKIDLATHYYDLCQAVPYDSSIPNPLILDEDGEIVIKAITITSNPSLISFCKLRHLQVK